MVRSKVSANLYLTSLPFRVEQRSAHSPAISGLLLHISLNHDDEMMRGWSKYLGKKIMVNV
jgi:hypothetical protein